MGATGATGGGRRTLAVLPLVLGGVYTLALTVYAYAYSTFVGDDLSTFYAIRTTSFGRYLLSLLGGQLVVLHRLLTWVLYELWPMRFLPAVLVLAALHVVGAVYVYRTLETMRPSRINAVLVGYYLMSVFIGVQLTWWSSGLTRFAYIALGTLAVHHYVRHARTGNNRELLFVLVGGVAAFGFYAKAILIPLYCVAVDLVSGIDKSALGRKKKVLRLGTVALLILAGAAYSLMSRHILPPGFRQVNTDAAYQLAFVPACFTVFMGGLADLTLPLWAPVPLWFVAVTVAFVGYSSVRSLRALSAWALLAGLVVLNFLVVGMSSRTLIWRTEMIVEYRHYFELFFFVVLLVGTVFHRLRDTPEARIVAGRDPRVLAAVSLGFLGLHGYASAHALGCLLHTDHLYATLPASRAFLDNLRVDLDRLAKKGGATPAFVDDFFPRDLDYLDFSFVRYSQLFLVLGAEVRFVPVMEARYAVGSDGHVVNIKGGNVVR